MTPHIIGEAIFDITFGPEEQNEDVESTLARMVQSRLLPVIEEVFDEMALDREAVRIDRLEIDLGPVRDDELESELATRLREKLRDALRDYVLAREKTVVAGSSPVLHSPADLDKLAYFLRYGHLTWNTSVGGPDSVVDLLEEALLQSPDQISSLFEGSADFDTVVFRLGAQFPENAVQDLVDRLARADPGLAAKVAAALKINRREAAGRAHSDEQGVTSALELYERLRRQLTEGEAREAVNPGQVSRLLEGAADFDTVVFRLASQLPENAVQDLVDRIATADPALAAKVAAALNIQKREAAGRARYDEQGGTSVRELYDRLKRQLTEGDAREAVGPGQVSRLLEGTADFDTVVFRLASQLPENAVQDLVDRIATADPALAAKVAAALNIQKREAAEHPVRSDEQGIARAYELYDRLRRQLTEGDAQKAANLVPLIEELRRKYPWQLLRLYRELQAGEGRSIRIPGFYGVDELRHLVDAFLSVEEEITHSIKEFRQSIEFFADKSADKKAYYTEVLHRLIRNEVLDLEAFSTHSGPAEDSGEVGDDGDPPSLLTERPERAREWFRRIAADPLALHALIERSPEGWLLRVLHLFQESSADRLLQAADGVIESAYTAGMKLSYAKVALLKWEFILSAVVSEKKSFEKARFIDELGQLISADVPRQSRDLFLSRLHDAPPAAAAQIPLSWDVLIRAYELYDLVLQRLEAEVESREFRTSLQELRQKYPLLIRRLYRAVQADAGRLIRIQQTLSPADLGGLLEVFLRELHPGREQASALWEAISQHAALSEDPGRFYGRALQRLLRRLDVDLETLVAAPSTEELDEQVFYGMTLLLEGGVGAIRGEDLAGRFEAILRDRPERAQRWLLEALSSEPGEPGEPTPEAARFFAIGLPQPLLRERGLLDVFRQFGAGKLAGLIRTADAVADTLLMDSASISDRELSRLKWAFLVRYALEQGSDSGPEVFAAEFAVHLEEHLLSVPERVRRIQFKLWDRSQPLNEPFLVQTLRSLEIPAGEGLLLAADAIAHTFYRAGLALPQSEIARLKWQMIFSDTLLEEADWHTEEFARDFEALLRDRLDDAESRRLPRGAPPREGSPRAHVQTEWSGMESSFASPDHLGPRLVEASVPRQMGWDRWVRAYEFYDVLRRTLVHGQPYSAAGLMAALEETLRVHPWQLLRLYREMRAGDGISDRLKDLYRADELRRVAAALLAVSVEDAETSRELLEAIAAFEPREIKDGDLRGYYANVLEELVQAGRPPAFAATLAEASLREKIRWIQAKLKDPVTAVPERFLVHVLREMDSPAIRRLLQTADSITDAYYRAGVALPHGEVARLKWEMLFSDALLNETETHAAQFAEHFQALIEERLEAETVPLFSAPLASPVPVFTEFGWTSAARAYELYDLLRRTLVDGESDSGSGLMSNLAETLRVYPWQLLRLYREMQAGDGLSVRFKDFYSAEELRRVVEALLDVSADYPRRATEIVVAFESDAADLRLYYADVLEHLVQARRPPAAAAAFIAASLPEKLRWIQARLRDRSQSPPERLLVQVLHEIGSPAAEGLLRTADSVADGYYRAAVVLPAREIARLKWELIFSDALLEEPERHAAEFAEHFPLLLNERVVPVGQAQPAAQSGFVALSRIPSPGSSWNPWIRAYELYDRLRRVFVEGKPDDVAALMAVLEETLRLYPWQLLRLYREMQAGDGLSDRVKALYGAVELQRIVEAFLTVSEEEAGAFHGLKKSILAFAQQSKDQDSYYAAVLAQLVRGEVIDLELAVALSSEEKPEAHLPRLSELVRLARSSNERAGPQFVALLRGLRESEAETLLSAADAVIHSRIARAPVPGLRDLTPLKWEFLFGYAISERRVFDPVAFAAEFARFLDDRVKSEGVEVHGEWRDLVRSYDLYEDLQRALLGTGAVSATVKELVEELAQSYPWQIRKLYRELESAALQAGILRSRDADALGSLIHAFARTVSLDPALVAMMEQELATASPDDAVQRYSRVLERLILSRVKERQSTPLAPLAPLSPQPSAPGDDARELVRVAEDVLRSGLERLQRWIEERLSSGAGAERLVRLLPEGLIARILITGAPSSSPASLLVTAERLAMAASTPLVGLSPRRARELKWMFVLRYAIVEKRAFADSQFLSGFAGFIHSETSLPSVEALTTTLAGQAKIDGMALLIRQDEDKTYGAVELERGISLQNAGMVLAAPYLPRLFAELNLTEGRKFRSDDARNRAVHLLQFMVNESEETAEHELVLNKILCGMDTAAPIQRRIELADREKVMVEGLIRGMILNWKKLGQTSVAGFRESFLQREGTLRLTDDVWQLEVFPRAFDMLLDFIPWTFETIKHPWMKRMVHVQWR